MSIKVCKTVVTEGLETQCRGTREFKVCDKVFERRDNTVCGNGDTYETAKQDMFRKLDYFVKQQCPKYFKCEVKKPMSAEDEGFTFYDFLSSVILSCNAGQEYNTNK